MNPQVGSELKGPQGSERRVGGALEANVPSAWHMTARRRADALAGGALYLA